MVNLRGERKHYCLFITYIEKDRFPFFNTDKFYRFRVILHQNDNLLHNDVKFHDSDFINFSPSNKNLNFSQQLKFFGIWDIILCSWKFSKNSQFWHFNIQLLEFFAGQKFEKYWKNLLWEFLIFFFFFNNLEHSWTYPVIGNIGQKNHPSLINLGPYFSTLLKFWSKICQIPEKSGESV